MTFVEKEWQEMPKKNYSVGGEYARRTAIIVDAREALAKKEAIAQSPVYRGSGLPQMAAPSVGIAKSVFPSCRRSHA